jgi:hypothetical protein
MSAKIAIPATVMLVACAVTLTYFLGESAGYGTWPQSYSHLTNTLQNLLPCDADKVLTNSSRRSDPCTGGNGYVFVKYVPSKLELWWNASIMNVSRDWNNLGCPKVREDEKKYENWFAASVSTKTATISEDEAAMSYHVYQDSCSKEEKLIRVPIEPIMGILRHPYAICMPHTKQHGDVFRKDWLILPNSEYFKGRNHPKVIMYDLGASTYKTGAGGASQEWFVSEFARRGMAFDEIYAWEAAKHEPADIFKDVPPNMLPKLRYYNVPVQVEPDGLHNPIRILKISAKEEDYVVVKLDIDTSWLEIALMQQLMADDDALRLVDELFFEHHTLGNPIVRWWKKSAQGHISGSYSMFTELRMRGVRAHSWV